MTHLEPSWKGNAVRIIVFFNFLDEDNFDFVFGIALVIK